MSFSIVIPVHDKPHTIRRTLDSVLAQTFGDFELILVGEPGDSSLAIASATADPRMRIVHLANVGPGPTRNAGIEASRSDWIAFLDADDLWLPGHLAELDRIRRARPDAGLIATGFVHSDPDGRFTLPPDRAGSISEIDYFAAVGRGENAVHTSSAAIPRASFERFGGFRNTPLGEDHEYWARIAFERPVAVSSRVTVVYLHGTGGLTESGRGRWAKSELRSARDISPAVALAIDRHGSLPPERRRGVALYIRRYQDWCLRTSIALRDVATIRRLRRIYWGRPSAAHVVLMGIALLPDGVAIRLYGFGLGLKAIRRSLFRQKT